MIIERKMMHQKGIEILLEQYFLSVNLVVWRT